MAKFFETKKWKKRSLTALSVALCATLSLGVFAACAPEEEDDETEDSVARTDTQLIKNGDFEFYSEMTKELSEKRALLNSPTSWSFTSGSPSSATKSGLINTQQEEWDSMTKSSFSLLSPDGTEKSQAIAYGYAHWDEASIYDRLQFLDEYKTEIGELSSSSDEKKLFNKYSYSVDFEDVKDLRKDLGEENGGQVALRTSDKEEKGVLMIHNSPRKSDGSLGTSEGTLGTAQYYTSSTTVTLDAGTSAEISVWVKTLNLYHYEANKTTDEEETTLPGVEVTRHGGAYVGVTNTVGGTTLDQMQIKNINTRDVTENNGWEEYKVYIRANTYASTTFRIVLGLGQGSSDNRYEAVEGYALFDDLTCKIISNEDYAEATKTLYGSDVNDLGDSVCTLNDKSDAKKFDATELKIDNKNHTTFALDLYAAFQGLTFDNKNETTTQTLHDADFDLTKEISGNREYSSATVSPSKLGDNRKEKNGSVIQTVSSLASLQTLASTNGYLKTIVEKDFKAESYPFNMDSPLIMLLSTNGAAYTAKLPQITVPANERMLISFFVKTSAIMNGRTGASATLVDGENKSAIAAFDSTTIDTVDIDNGKEDIYDGWVQCFFFVTNDTDEAKPFHIELSYGPTTIVGTDEFDYGQGYAAFANFETAPLTKTQVSYASATGRAVKVSLTSSIADSTRFDGVSAASPVKIENGLANPSSFTGVVSGSKFLEKDSKKENKLPENVYAGLLNSEYAEDYKKPENDELTEGANSAWLSVLDKNNESDWWSKTFGDSVNAKKVARQPLVIVNAGTEAASSYGFFEQKQTIAANTYQRISMRVKLSENAKAYIYLIDTSDLSGYGNRLSPNLPAITYWYDDDGNITDKDPSEKDAKIIYYLQDNGLYKSADGNDTKLYANLHNYKELNGNLVTEDETVAFYGKDGVRYAYKDYTQPVENLPTTYARYNYTNTKLPSAAICVDGADNAGRWVEVSFYVHTGSNPKNYRLEVWAGERDNATDGIPAKSYVAFDNYSSSSVSDYDDLLALAKEEIRNELNSGKVSADKDYLGKNDNLPANYATYYTFTFFDSTAYLRYDVNEDEDEVGNRYASYLQSDYSEQIVFLAFNDAGKMTGSPSNSLFLDYSAIETTVTPDEVTDDDTSDDDTATSEPISVGDILIIVSSSLLAVVLIAVIIILAVRQFRKKHPKKERAPKASKDKRVKPKKETAPQEEKEPEPKDENDPYNE